MREQIANPVFKPIFQRMSVKDKLCCIFSVIFYERFRERLSLILHFIVFAFLNLIRPLLNSKVREKIHRYNLSFWKINLFRHPVFISNISKKLLRVCITYRCNTSCKICYAKGLFDEFPKDMSLDDFSYLIRWAKQNGWRKMMFLGGEPTVHPQFPEILDICHRQNISVDISTNGLFDDRILLKLKPPLIEEVFFDYLEGQIPSADYKERFLYNLEYLKKKRVILVLQGVIDGETEIWKEIIDIAARFKLPARWAVIFPGYGGDLFNQRVFSNPQTFGSQLLEILKTCVEKNVLCNVYRPVMMCMFTPEQLQQIRKMGRHLIVNRCMLGYRGDYTLALTVNPDLSTYPCNNFYIKGPSIKSFKDRASINRYYEETDKAILMTAPVAKCNNCQFYQNFLSVIKDRGRLVKERLSDENICQAGCADFRKGARLCYTYSSTSSQREI